MFGIEIHRRHIRKVAHQGACNELALRRDGGKDQIAFLQMLLKLFDRAIFEVMLVTSIQTLTDRDNQIMQGFSAMLTLG